MKNISFDNPWLLLIAVPAILLVLIPFLIARNKDNKKATWTISLVIHFVIITLVTLAIAGLSTVSTLTKTTVYVVADVSYSSEQNLDKIDEHIAEIKENLPDKASMGVVCFGKEWVISTRLGKRVNSVKDAELSEDAKSATDIAGALNYTATLFTDDSIKRIILITDGNDTVAKSTSSVAAVVDRLKGEGIKVDAIFLDNSVKEGETEVQLLETEFKKSTYIGHENQVKFLLQSAKKNEVLVELFSREKAKEGEEEKDFSKIYQSVVTADSGLTPVKFDLPSNAEGTYEYRIDISADGDLSSYNNSRTFVQTVVGKEKILVLTGSSQEKALFETIYGSRSEMDTYVVSSANTRVPFLLEDLVQYDEIIISNLDIRNIRNVNAFIDSLDTVIAQYGKSLLTFGDLKIQTNADDPVFKKFKEILPVDYGSTSRDGKLYTIVLDVSHSMYMASKFFTAQETAKKLISVLDEEDYLCFITFSGEVKIQTPSKVKDCKEDLIEYINKLTTAHGTDMGLGLEEALKMVRKLDLSENQIVVVSDGFSFENEYDAVEVAKNLKSEGAQVTSVCTYIPSDGSGGLATMNNVASAGGTNKAVIISRPEDAAGIVFGTIANEISEAIVNKEASVTVKKNNDSVISGFVSFDNISKFIISKESYDAVVPLTVTYVKPSGIQDTVPLYAYRAHINGKVASFTSSLTDSWMKNWSAEEKSMLVTNIITTSTPATRIDHPFTIKLDRTDYDATVEILPSVLNPDAKVKIVITAPNPNTQKGYTVKTRELPFDASKYYYNLETPYAGVYTIDITYTYDEMKFTASESFNIPYLTEYDAFATFDKFSVYEIVRDNGEVVVDGIPSLENDKSLVQKYKKSFAIPLLIAAVSLFVIDVFIRKLRINKKSKAKVKASK